jgi:fatty acid desaturase
MNPEARGPEGEAPADPLAWKELVAPYQTPTVWRSVWQVVNTLVPYVVLWYLMYRSLEVSYWLTLPLAIVAAGVLVRVFILFGLKAYLLLQLTVLLVAGAAGVWPFYVQHQFEGVYWARHDEWDATQVALRGSSFYRLPKVLQWFTGNIGSITFII